jgi:ADP-ribose pyrophosphatase YjhB (NUDIX family)
MKQGQDYIGVSVVHFCHDGKGNFLMNKRSNNCRDEHGCWDNGGGSLDFGYTVEETLEKEVKEEYCSEIISYDFLGYRDVHRKHNGKETHWLALDFKVLVDPNKVANGEPHKFEEIGWFTLDTLPNPLHSQLPDFFEKYKDKLR